MEHFKIITQNSPLLIFLCILIGCLYAFLLYQPTHVFKKNVRYILASLRFTLVTLICLLLLLNPLMKQFKNTLEKPTIVFAIDNSQSISNITQENELKQLTTGLEQIRNDLNKQDINTDIVFFDKKNNQSLVNIPFKHPTSNLYQLLAEVQNNYENRNIDKVVFLSDGIFNQGISPTFANYNFSIYSVGLGDPTPKRDIKIQSVLANKVAYMGNKFPITIEIENIGFANRNISCYLSQNNALIYKKVINFGNETLQTVTFYANATTKGIQRYTLQVENLDGEFSTQNNTRDIYIEVIEGKEKILFVSLAPHPDIKAIRSALEKNSNYSFELHIPMVNQLKEDKYDMVIFHQIPNRQGIGNDIYTKYTQAGVPTWVILGSQSNIPLISQSNKTVKILSRSGQLDKITPYFNRKFNRFNFDNEKLNVISKFPPAYVPFGDYTLSNNAEVILYQKVGNLETDKPLLVLGQNESNKQAFMLGEGLWQWRMEEFELNNTHETFDELINKFVQLLSVKDDKRRLRVYPVNEEIYNFEKIVFETEVYNEIYEKVYNQKINLNITNDQAKVSTYSYTITQGNSRFELSGLPKGVYAYTASVALNNKVETVSGQFIVKDLQLEALNTTADHNLLKLLADKNKGKFFTPTQLNELRKALMENKKPNFIQSTEEIAEFINLKWLFFLLLALATAEWFVRKYQGAY